MGARGYGGGAQRSERGSWLLFLGRGLLGGLRDFNWFDLPFCILGYFIGKNIGRAGSFSPRDHGPAVGARHMCCVQRRDTHKDAACVLCKLSHEQPQTLYDIQRCEAPQQPKSRRRGIIECRFCTLASLARRDGLYARRTPRHFDRSRASGQLRKWARGLTQRSGRDKRAF